MPSSPHNRVFFAILLMVLFHGALLPFTYGQTYDAYIHMFFGNHYYESWFDPWESKWYTGFTVTAYPPGSHQLIAILMHIVDMRVAFVLVFLLALILLVIGVYRFCQIWVDSTPASYAALLSVFMSGISETVHIFGQLPTILSIAIFLNAIPFIYSWIARGRKRDFFFALIFTAGATAVHHVTPLFGTIFFVAPVGLAAWTYTLLPDNMPVNKKWMDYIRAPMRGMVLGACMLALILTIVFPYWYWSLTDPINQVSISHGSRVSFLKELDLGLMFFVIPWGMMILILPYAAFKSWDIKLWPLGISAFFAFLLGTGGTTPIPRMILGHAFDILTLDRFTFWSTLLCLPFAGMFVQSVLHGRMKDVLLVAFGKMITRTGLVLALVLYVGAALSVALLPMVRPTQPDFIEPGPIVKFMSEDNHANWRYLTLGFGDQFAYHSALIDAESVDGNYHSARRLPSLTNYAVERLENSKYAGVPGLASLNQFLTNADHFHLKYIFSNDEYYDPLLHFTGWNPVNRLQNGVMVWEKPNILPLPVERSRRKMSQVQTRMWGILPISSVFLMLLTTLGLAIRGRLVMTHTDITPPSPPFGNRRAHRVTVFVLRMLLIAVVAGFVWLVSFTINRVQTPMTPDKVVADYYAHLDFREYAKAFEHIDMPRHGTFGDFLRDLRETGGLVPSYGKLSDVQSGDLKMEKDGTVTLSSKLSHLTALGHSQQSVTHTLRQSADGSWKIKYIRRETGFSDAMFVRRRSVSFHDLSDRFIDTPDFDAVKMLKRPRITLSDIALYREGARFFVSGRVHNIDAIPACVAVNAKALDSDGTIMLSQDAGSLGAHRLMPGDSSIFKLTFEGFLKIKDAAFDDYHNPYLFSLPEFESPPTLARVTAVSTVCTPVMYQDVTVSNFEQVGDTLITDVTNTGDKLITTLQIKISETAQVMNPASKTGLTSRGGNNGLRLTSHFLQYNLNPGETRRVNIPLNREAHAKITDVRTARVNGKPIPVKTRVMRNALTLNERMFTFDLDAMTYEPLR